MNQYLTLVSKAIEIECWHCNNSQRKAFLIDLIRERAEEFYGLEPSDAYIIVSEEGKIIDKIGITDQNLLF